MLRKRSFWIGLAMALLLAGGGYLAYREVYLPSRVPQERLMTAEATRGDLTISVSGTGVLNPSSQRELGFQTESGEGVTGYLEDVLVEVGDRVEEGDLLARLETEELRFAVVKAHIELRRAQLDLAEVSEAATEAELAAAEAALESARLGLRMAQLRYENAQKSSHQADARDAQIAVQHHAEQIWELEANGSEGEALAEAWSSRHKAEAAFDEALQAARMESLEAENELDQAENRVLQAEDGLAGLQGGPEERAVLRAKLKVDRAELASEQAREDLEAAELRAPFTGTVVEVSAMAGERVGSSAVVILADLDHVVMKFWVEESDASGVAVSDRVEIAFEALPDEVFDGEVTRIEPALVTVGNTLAVQAWASLNLSSRQIVEMPDTLLREGMNADIEIIGAEARDVVLVPLQALREIGDGQHAVFVVQSNGELAMRLVEVGLQDYVNAEIVSGLEAGETISLGAWTDSSGASDQQEEQMPGPPGGMVPGGGLFGGGPGGRP